MNLNTLNTKILERFDKFRLKGWDEEQKIETSLSEFLSPDEVGQVKQFLLEAIKESYFAGRQEVIKEVKIGLSHIDYTGRTPDNGDRYYEAHKVFELLRYLTKEKKL